MYNRYIPGTNGVYERKTVLSPREVKSECREEPPAAITETCPEPPVQPAPCSRKWIPQGLDIGDLLLLCIVLLLLFDSEEEDAVPLLITAAVVLFS